MAVDPDEVLRESEVISALTIANLDRNVSYEHPRVGALFVAVMRHLTEEQRTVLLNDSTKRGVLLATFYAALEREHNYATFLGSTAGEPIGGEG